MGFMTLAALQRLGMHKMTLLAVQFRVCTRMSVHLLTLISVATETGRLCIVNSGKIYLHRIMGIVTGLTVGKRVMGMIAGRVTDIALRDGIFSVRRMFFMTVHTSDIRLMQASSAVYIPGFCEMTLDTVIAVQFRGLTRLCDSPAFFCFRGLTRLCDSPAFFCQAKNARVYYQCTSNNTDENRLFHPCPHPSI
jgi:hypothetical protein